ncbi:hypothetical protein [Rhizobium sp. BK060]|nr:hypothetical protein [Rhizobium sp. BK060]MBB3398619.1 hypothetical protein [Rhizobium sp. BK060]
MTKLLSSLAPCMFLVGLSRAGAASAEDAMKKADMMKACDAMK